MRVAVVLSFAALASGCAVVPPSAWNFDPDQALAKPQLPAQEAGALTDRLAQLQSERNAIRARIAGERDVGQRQRLYEQLHRVGLQLSPLERRLGAVASAR